MKEFRVRMMTRDGVLVQDRKSDPRFWFYNGRPDERLAKISVEADAREKGVRVISYTVHPTNGVEALVEWLR